jgi:hypothetical protein
MAQKEIVWSERAYCYKMIIRSGKTFLYYRCLDTNKTKRLNYDGLGLSRSAYVGTTSRMIDKFNQ